MVLSGNSQRAKTDSLIQYLYVNKLLYNSNILLYGVTIPIGVEILHTTSCVGAITFS